MRSSSLVVVGLFPLLLLGTGCPEHSTEEPPTGSLVGDDDDEDVPQGPFAAVALNEISSDGDDLVELISLEDEESDLGGFALLDDDTDHDLFVIPEGTIIAPGGFLTFDKDDLGFGLGAEDGVQLFDPAGDLVGETAWVEGAAERSWCRVPDGDGPWTVCSTATPGGPNVDEPEDDLVSPLFVAGLDRWDEDGVRVEGPNELAFDEAGRIWAGDQKNLTVQVFAADGTFVASLGGIGEAPGEYAWSEDGNRGPESMKTGPDGRMFVVDRIGQRINVYDPDTLEAGAPIDLSDTIGDPTGFAIAQDGTMYVADQATHQVGIFSAEGVHEGWLQTHDAAGDLVLFKVETLALDEPGDRLFATSENERYVEIYRLSTGEYLEQSVSEEVEDGEIAPGRILDTMEGIIVDPDRRILWICDEEAGRFMAHDIDDDGLTDPARDFAFLGAFGAPGSGPGEFLSPDGIAVSKDGARIAIADQGNDRIQVFATSDVTDFLGLQEPGSTD